MTRARPAPDPWDLLRRYDGGGPVVVLRRAPSLLLAGTDTVVKVHEPGTEPGPLAVRLGVAARLDGTLLGPRATEPVPVRLDAAAEPRWASVWPRARALHPDDEAPPWAALGERLAALHTADPLDGLPPHRAPRRLDRDLGRLARALDEAGSGVAGSVTAAATTVRAARARLDERATTAGARGRPVRVVHGDLHLGQLVEVPAGWRLLDVDDLGLGDPAWDLGRPAAFRACGLLAEADWRTLLDAYRSACRLHGEPGAFGLGPDASGDPWSVLDGPARACVVQTAAAAVARVAEGIGAFDEVDARLLAACGRIAAGA